MNTQHQHSLTPPANDDALPVMPAHGTMTRNPEVSEATLLDLRAGGPERDRGELTPEHQALAAMAIPDIVDELLHWRRTAAERPHALALALRSEAIEARLAQARRTIRAPDPIHHRALGAACETLLRHSTDAAERTAAADVLAQMRGCA